MDTLVIEVGATGKVSSLHTDKFDLGFLGDKKIRRQTEILFREGPQTWSICLVTEDGEVLNSSETFDGFSGYEEAREFEVRWINNCRLHQIPPESYLGLVYARFLRFGPQGEDKCFTLPDGSCIADDCMHVPKG